MSVYLFTALCYLLLYGTLYGQTLVNGQTLQVTEDNFELFKENPISGAKIPGALGNADNVNVKNYDSPVLVSTKKFVFALASVERTEEETAKQRYIDILTKYVQNEDVLTAGKWTPQFAVQHQVTSSDANYFVKGLLAVAAEEKVYLLLLNYTKKTLDSLTDPKWDFKFAVATINSKEEEDPATQIVWDEHAIDAANVNDKLKTQFTKEPDTGFSFSGSAFLTEENKMVFALVVDDSTKKISVVMQLDDDKKKNRVCDYVHRNCWRLLSLHFSVERKDYNDSS